MTGPAMTGVVPGPWRPAGPPAGWRAAPGGVIEVVAEGGTDRYAMPGVREVDALPVLLRRERGDFTLTATVTVGGSRFADAAGLVAQNDAGSLKVCVEHTTTGSWALITVASWPESDEAMGPGLAGPAAELALTRQGSRCAALFREPGAAEWRFARTFRLAPGDLDVGLFAQAPFSDGCTARFAAATVTAEPLPDRR